MKNSVKNKMKMYKAVESVLLENESSWNSLPVFEGYITSLSDKLEVMESYVTQQVSVLLGVRVNKDKERLEVAKLALVFSNALRGVLKIHFFQKTKIMNKMQGTNFYE